MIVTCARFRVARYKIRTGRSVRSSGRGQRREGGTGAVEGGEHNAARKDEKERRARVIVHVPVCTTRFADNI